MDLRVILRAEQTLLKELDARLQSQWHESLRDVITDLRIRWVDIKPDAKPDELISVIHSSRLLDFVTDKPLIEIRDAVNRITRGTFGFCVGCGNEIPAETLASKPTMTLCSASAHRLDEARDSNQTSI